MAVMKYARYLEIALGAVFILSAALKALDVYSFAVQVSYYGVVRDPAIVQFVAGFMVVLEAALGAALLGGMRYGGLTVAVTAALLLAFTALVAYAWIFEGLEDCGCFGEYIKMGPTSTIVKNLVLLALTAGAWYGARQEAPPPDAGAEAPAEAASKAPDEPPGGRRRSVLAVVGLGIVAAAYAYGGRSAEMRTPAPVDTTGLDTKSRPFAKYQPDLEGVPVDLGEGEYLVAILSADCEHCQAAAEVLNQLAEYPDVPQIAAIMTGHRKAMDEFRAKTAPVFPIQIVETLEFFTLIDRAPPRFYLIRDGVEVRHLDSLDPTVEDLHAFATGQGQ
ncbi:MAG: hypothetical protein AMXMBFR4_00580 [Candidatus Hydrogenedentota bacterium]